VAFEFVVEGGCPPTVFTRGVFGFGSVVLSFSLVLGRVGVLTEPAHVQLHPIALTLDSLFGVAHPVNLSEGNSIG
jgi:hypothetical protein